ncbi:MAG: O-antigen ligase family protein [Nostoc sp. NOS(2021)]|uniref:O-antigen ligase family protein n=1 Tax=Nostoc sp. NOS(2021) TaxID=2815407 RepID=UPI0025F09B12|nr:O-antigen ligase family protein [Nostoc sp. NOS(2021)]MBN3894909.1 O-antigen ligase family protein [Nostoc sp. NOS(2021)]
MNLKISVSSFYLKVKILLFSIALFGYGIIASSIKDASTSRLTTIPYRAIVISLSILVLLFIKKKTNASNNTKTNKQKKVSLSLLVFIFIIFYTFRIIYDLGYNDLLVKESSEYLLNWFGICLIPGITFLFLDLKSSKKYLYLSWMFLTLASILALPLIAQGQVSKTFTEQGRLGGEAFNPISLGHQGGSLLLISLYVLLNRESSKNRITKILYIFSLVTGLILLFFAASKGPIIAIIVCVCLLLVSLQRQGVNIFKISGIIVIVAIFANIAFSFSIDSGSGLLERFSSLLNGDDFDDSRFVQRPELYQKASELITEYPIFGYGLEIPNLGYPHNLILEAFLATGLLGGSLFVIIYIYAAIKAIGIIMAKNSSWSWLGLLYIQYSIGTMFSGSLYGSYTFWYLLFAIFGLKKLDKLVNN